MIYWPVMNIVVWGFFTFYLAHRGGAQPGIVSSLLGAVILWGLFNAFQRDMAVGFLDELWSKNLVNLFGSPLTDLGVHHRADHGKSGQGADRHGRRISDRLALLPLQHFSHAAYVCTLHFQSGTVRAGGRHRRHWTHLPLHHRFQVLAWGFAGLLMPFSCVFYPLKSLPDFLHPVAWILPTTHSFEGMRQAIAGEGFSFAISSGGWR